MPTSLNNATQSATVSADERRGAYGQGGPVFLPSRKLSPLAEAILASPTDGDRVTAYDEIWYLGRPQEA